MTHLKVLVVEERRRGKGGKTHTFVIFKIAAKWKLGGVESNKGNQRENKCRFPDKVDSIGEKVALAGTQGGT